MEFCASIQVCWEEYLATEAIWAPGLYWFIVSLDFMGVFLCQVTICSQIVVWIREKTQRKRVSPGSYRAGRMFCRDGYDWCWDSDRLVVIVFSTSIRASLYSLQLCQQTGRI